MMCRRFINNPAQSRSDNYFGVIPSFGWGWRSADLGRDVLFIIITLKLTTDQLLGATAAAISTQRKLGCTTAAAAS